MVIIYLVEQKFFYDGIYSIIYADHSTTTREVYIGWSLPLKNIIAKLITGDEINYDIIYCRRN